MKNKKFQHTEKNVGNEVLLRIVCYSSLLKSERRMKIDGPCLVTDILTCINSFGYNIYSNFALTMISVSIHKF